MGTPAPPKKKRQHYVWQHYLSGWEVKGKVQCWREGTIFATGTKNLGVEAYFYALRDLDSHDDALIGKLIEACAPHLRPVAEGWRNVFAAPSQLVKKMGAWPEVLKRKPEDLLAAVADLEEELHCLFEQAGKPLLDSLRMGHVPSPEDMAELLPFLTTQYTRTKAIQESVTRATDGVAAGVWQVMRHVYASNMAMQILMSGEFKADVLEAPDGHRFITGDQPIVNTQGIWKPKGQEATDLELYYPVSPAHSLLVSKQSSWSQRPITLVEVNARNATMGKAAYAQVYGQQASDLDHVATDRTVGQE